jgi:hypothetical protein
MYIHTYMIILDVMIGTWKRFGQVSKHNKLTENRFSNLGGVWTFRAPGYVTSQGPEIIPHNFMSGHRHISALNIRHLNEAAVDAPVSFVVSSLLAAKYAALTLSLTFFVLVL